MLRGIAVAIVIAALCSSAYAADRVSASEKGSLLVYPKIEVKWNDAGDLIQDTFISLNNDYYQDRHIVMFFISDTLECDGVYHDTVLTANEAAYWSAATGYPKMVGPFSEADPADDPWGCGTKRVAGFILAFATDDQNQQVRWNHLYGAATIINYDDGFAWEYNAYAFQVNTDNYINGNVVGTPGEILMNGDEYEMCFDTLIMDFYASNDLTDGEYVPSAFGDLIKIDTDLTLVIADWDMRQGGGTYITKANFWIWNENEDSRQTHYCVQCWDQSLLSSHGGPFLISNLQTDKGRARIEGVAAAECDTTVITCDERPLLGVQAKFGYEGATLCDGIEFAAGSNLWGSCPSTGCEAGALYYDVTPDPGEKKLSGIKLLPTHR